MNTDILVTSGGMVLAAWFWFHCAQPSLYWSGARPAATRIVLGLTVLWIAAQGLYLATILLDADVEVGRQLSILTGLPYVVVVGGGFLNDYRILIRLVGGVDLLAALQRALWHLGYALDRIVQSDHGKEWPKRVQDVVDMLPRYRNSDTDRIIDLWLAEAHDVLGAPTDHHDRSERHELIRAEAQRLWPTDDPLNLGALVRG